MKILPALLQRYALVVLIVLTSASCSPYKAPLTVGASPWPSSELLFLAQQLGYLDENEFSLFELPSSTSVIQAFQTGKLDVALLSLDEVLTLTALGIDLKIVSVLDQAVGGYALLSKPDIKYIEDLKWHSIGYENKAAGALLLGELFSITELSGRHFKLLEVKQNEAADLYLKDNVDAIIVREPQKQQLLALGARELLNSSALGQPITHLMVARKAVYLSKADQIEKLLKHFYQSYSYYLTNKEDALASIAIRLQLYPYLLEDAFKELRIIEARKALMMLTGEPSDLALQAKHLSLFMHEKKMLGKVPSDFQKYISTAVLERVIYE